jgi:hypothetical protein
MLCYVTISTSSLYVSVIGCMEKNKDDDDTMKVDALILNLSARWKWVFSFTTQLLYSQRRNHRHPLNRRLGWEWSRSGCFGEGKNLLFLLGSYPGSSIPYSRLEVVYGHIFVLCKLCSYYSSNVAVCNMSNRKIQWIYITLDTSSVQN